MNESRLCHNNFPAVPGRWYLLLHMERISNRWCGSWHQIWRRAMNRKVRQEL